MAIDHRRRMARKGVFVAQRGSFKACAPGHDSIPQLGPCRALLGLPMCVTHLRFSRKVTNATGEPPTSKPYYRSVSSGYSIPPKGYYSALCRLKQRVPVRSGELGVASQHIPSGSWVSVQAAAALKC